MRGLDLRSTDSLAFVPTYRACADTGRDPRSRKRDRAISSKRNFSIYAQDVFERWVKTSLARSAEQ